MCKLHIGSGRVALPGWVNVDIQPLPEVDVVNDVTEGLPFDEAQFIFAEHFIEHLPFDAALQFLRECRRVLLENGVLRLSTPNLDWVLRSHYDPSRWQSTAEPIRDCLWLNKAFRGWGHCFLYNHAGAASECCGLCLRHGTEVWMQSVFGPDRSGITRNRSGSSGNSPRVGG